MDRANAPGILRSQGGDNARAVDAMRGEGPEISLDACAGAAIRAGERCFITSNSKEFILTAVFFLGAGRAFEATTNQALMPANFTRQSVQVVHDCRESTVEVRLPIDPLDPRSLAPAKDVDCDSRYAGTRQ